MKTISAGNGHTGTVALQVGVGGTGAGKDIYRTSGILAGSGIFTAQIDLVVMPGEAIYAKAGVANVVTVSLHGAQLLGEPA